MQITLPLELNGPTDLMVLEVSVVDKDVVWNLWQAPKSYSYHILLRCWSKALPSSTDNNSQFEKELLAFCWILLEIEQFIISH